MGTHPIFESDFDCLTERTMNNGMGALRTRLTQLTKVSSTPTQLARCLGSSLLPKMVQSATNEVKNVKGQQKSVQLVANKVSNIGVRFTQLNFNLPKPTFNGTNVTFASSLNQKMSRIFAAFDLMSVTITLIGYIGDAAVWAVQDKLTGDIQYVVDDS